MVQAGPYALFQYFIMATAAVGYGTQAYSAWKSGQAQATALEAEARGHEMEQRQAELKATQISAMRMAELNANISSIQAARAGKNLAGDSPTELALIKSFTKESLASKSNEVLDARLQRLGAINARYSALGSAKAARTAGMLGAISGTADMVAQFGNMIPNRNKPKPRSSTPRPTGGGRY